MAAAWQATIDLKLGIFAPDEEEISPLLASDENVPEIKRPDVAAHRIWLKVCYTFIIKYSMCTCACIIVRARCWLFCTKKDLSEGFTFLKFQTKLAIFI